MVEECTYFYYYEPEGAAPDQIKYYHCIQECTVSKNGNDIFFAKGHKNCEYSCSAFNKYFYSNHECLDTCIGLEGKEFADKDDNTPKEPKECKSSCDLTNTNYNYHVILQEKQIIIMAKIYVLNHHVPRINI